MKESQFVEFKESWRDEYLKNVSAFANTMGGKIYIGIRDDGSVCDVNNVNKLQEDLPNKMINILGIHASFSIRKKGGKQYLEIGITKSLYPISYRGRFYTRNGTTTQELKGNALQKLLLSSNNLTWDEIVLPGFSWDEIDNNAVKLFICKAIYDFTLY